MEEKIIISERNNSIIFPSKDINGPVLVIGHQYGMFGTIRNKGLHAMSNVWNNNIQILYSTISSGNKLIFVVPEYVSVYINRLLSYMVSSGWFSKKQVEKCVEISPCKTVEQMFMTYNTEEQMLMKIKEKYSKMKFDYIIQNPPYNGSLHLDFFEKGLDLLTEKGRMIIIEPATWLINVRKNGKAKKYDELKKRLEGHVESVSIENRNKEFGTLNQVPFSTTVIDMSSFHPEIKFTCGGYESTVKSIYDCNLVGKYDTIWSIIDKVTKYGDMMKSHVTKEEIGDSTWYAKYAEIFTSPVMRAAQDPKYLDEDAIYETTKNGDYTCCYTIVGFHNRDKEITPSIQKTRKSGGGKDRDFTDKNADCIYGTKEELENWKHFIFNNKLPLFLNIVLTIDQNNCSKEFLPWLVDKQYTDEEINQMFGFTDDEVAMIDRTIKKYERNSPWFKRYMCGPGSVDSDPKKEEEIINNFINGL